MNVGTTPQDQVEDEDRPTTVDGPVTVAVKLVQAGIRRWVNCYRPLFDRRLTLSEKINSVPFFESFVLIWVFIIAMICGLSLSHHYNKPPIRTYQPPIRTARQQQLDAEEELRILLLKESAEEAAETAKQVNTNQKMKNDDRPAESPSFPIMQKKGRN